MKPLIIEFTGMPNSGKSTSLRLIGEYYRNKGCKVLVIQEGIRKSKIKPKGGYSYNLWGLLNSVSSLIKHSNSYELILLDRGANDLRAFSDVLLCEGYLSKPEHRSLKTLTEEFAKQIDGYFLFTCSIDTSLSRDEKHSEDKSGIVMNTVFLSKLQNSYEQLYNTALSVLDSDKYSIDAEVYIITKHIDEMLKKNLLPDTTPNKQKKHR